jgi:hypothetical protein
MPLPFQSRSRVSESIDHDCDEKCSEWREDVSPMSLLAKLKELADRVLGEDQRAKHLREEELQLAAAALLVHASLIDGRADPEERRTLKSRLQVRFNLDEES